MNQQLTLTCSYVVNRTVCCATFCRIKPKQPYSINTCICAVVEVAKAEAKWNITDRYMTSAGLETTKLSNYDEVNK